MNKPDLIYVDDNSRDRLLLERVVKKYTTLENYLILTDGEELVDYIAFYDKDSENGVYIDAYFPSVILLDVKMPKITGLETLVEIRKHEKAKFIPVVMLSHSYLTSDIQMAFELGANGYLVKPKKFQSFKSQILTVCEFWLKENVLPYKDFQDRT